MDRAAAINLLTKAWAAEYGPMGVRLNAISLGPTRKGTAAMGEALQQLAAQAPAGRPAALKAVVKFRAPHCRTLEREPRDATIRFRLW
jgi:NAD(P)-dependent dehydrogenase (short-subunit alcohol dehydrogenase family)